MPTSRAGIWSKKNGGFTLFELVVTMMVMGMTALLVIPRIDPFSAGESKRITRRLAGLISHLTQESASTKEVYRLYFNLDSGQYWTAVVVGTGDRVTVREIMKKKQQLPDGIRFEDIMTAQHEMVNEGEIFTQFYPIGIEALTIHLKEGEGENEQHWTLKANPLTGRVKVFDHYVTQ
jgi:prepilin-type N-terminal cleavage/methylation domain-containing protein